MARKPKQTLEAAQNENNAQKPPPFIEVTNQESLDVEYRSRCGGALRSAREKLGLSTQDIAGRLRLSYKQIEALEADNFAILPEATIVKGFIRNYAKQLKIDAEPLLDAYNVIVPSKAPQSFTLHPTVDMRVTEYQKPSMLRNVLLGVLVAVSVVTWLFYQNYVQKPNPVKPSAELVEPATVEALPEAALPAAERPADQNVTELTLPNAAPADVAANVSAPTVPATPTVADAVPAATPVVSATASSPAAPNQMEKSLANPSSTPAPPVNSSQPAAGMSKLEFSASQETWVSVTDANGREIYSKTLFEGNRESIDIKPPVNITVGNSQGTTLAVNGKSVDLAPHTRTNVAHIKVD